MVSPMSVTMLPGSRLHRTMVNHPVLLHALIGHFLAAVLISLASTVSAGFAEVPSPDPTRPFLPAWKQVADRSGLSMLVTPAIPEHWPPQTRERPTALVRYAFAFRLATHLADGSEVAVPWARSVEGQDGSTAIQPRNCCGPSFARLAFRACAPSARTRWPCWIGKPR
jgi:hypothetical protein